MVSTQAVVLCAVLQWGKWSWGIELSFPPNFKFGATTAAYQVEGGWNVDGKGVNIWDRYVHEHPEDIKDRDTGDVAADSYHLWREDVRAAAKTKLQFYRFSISWSRILPSGFTNEINKAGVKYYSDLIDALLAEGIEPVVTMYHFDLPVKIQDLGGWTNPLIVNWFGAYARVLYTLYADRVKTWLTINEPVAICDYMYNSGLYAPGIREPVFGPYLCNKYVMLAHAKAYRIFDEDFRPKYTGKISLVNNVLWIEPLTANDTGLAELGRQHQFGRYSHQIFSKEGGWPPSLEKLMLEYSLKHGFKESRLPPYTNEEIEFMKGTADFYAMNYYTTNLIRPARPGEDYGVWFFDGSPELDAILEFPLNSSFGQSPLLPIVAKGIRKLMAWLKEQYGDIDILITENGLATRGNKLDDYNRLQYMRDHLEQVLLSIKVDNVSVIGFAAWSLIDNFEWLAGYSFKYGLYEVDFEHPNRTRTARASSHYYRCVIEKRSLDVPDSCFKNNHPVNRPKRIDSPKQSEKSGCLSTNYGFCLNIYALAMSFIVSKL
ncbi:myrosinase 1-like [Maniola hyperantus]|uniref:myrosinase 1-like n=1 Tax=Aphantopus hyperantus TaxID=2795564 RepID=UPI0037497153